MFSGSLPEWLQRLESLHPLEIELGLSRVAEVATRLGCTQFSCPVITVAGTNGKGTTVAAAKAFASAAGHRVVAYTSPHLLRFNERVWLVDAHATDAQLVAAFETVENARQDTPLTYFEFSTLAALVLFQDAAPDLVVLEVGLGGRLDAVNIIDPDIAVITSIALDHQSWLGDDVDSIALEKAGILRAGRPALLADTDAPPALLKRVHELGCPLLRPDNSCLEALSGTRLRPENLAAGWLACAELGMAPPLGEAAELAAALILPGRLQELEYDGHRVLLDVAHNPAAVDNLLLFLGQQPAVAVFAALADKDIKAMIAACRGRFDQWLVPALPDVPRAIPAEQLARVLREQGENVTAVGIDPAATLGSAIQGMTAEHILVVFGSFYTVSAIMERLQRASL